MTWRKQILLVTATLLVVGADRPPLSLTEVLAGRSTEGFARAVHPRTFQFPDDHGPHKEFRNEWWYVTGNLTTAGGRSFGYQYTLFRSALTAETSDRESNWATNQVYMAHFALTDPVNETFHAYERFSRGAAGLAGAETRPFRAWIDDWQISGGDDPPPFRLQVSERETALELVLDGAKPVVLQGDRGLSRKGNQEGNASYYYSLTRMPTRGTVTVGFKTFEVQGSSWLDREWSTSALEEDQIGWDWFALHLSDGQDLMVYQLRRADGSAHPRSSGILVGVDGAGTSLGRSDFEIETLERWKSPSTKVTYPARWRIELSRFDLRLEVTPVLPNQELDLAIRYWEGAVTVSGSSAGEAISGKGYVELTGYE